jgi:hypothetical protein
LGPIAATPSRQGAIPVMPARAQPSICCCSGQDLMVAELIASHRKSLVKSRI